MEKRCGERLLYRDLELIEVNPVLVSEPGVVALDASIRTRAAWLTAAFCASSQG